MDGQPVNFWYSKFPDAGVSFNDTNEFHFFLRNPQLNVLILFVVEISIK